MKETFVEKNFGVDSLSLIATINDVLKEYENQGYDLSLRQLYYQLVARDYIENTLQSYKRIGNLVSDARLAGMIDWDMIVDRNRETVTPPHWDSPHEIVRACAQQFRIDKWAVQPVHIEVMVEKQALEGVLIPVCRELDIRFTANKGYASSSLMYETGKRIQGMIDDGKEAFILYLGDHDPSGIDMTRDILDRLEMFADNTIDVERLALNMDQVEKYNPPENPAKTTDSRFKSYVVQFGESSWELDALEPSVLADIVRDFVGSLRDDDLWQQEVEREKTMRAQLNKVALDLR